MKSLKLFQPFEKGINTVIFYAPKDEPYNEELAKHLFQLRQENYINDWDPSQLDPGSDVDRVLDEKIKKAEIIIFLVSADFLSSPEGEAVRKMALKKRKNFAKIVFVLARPCLYPEAYNEEILLPAKAKAISKWDDKDEAYTSIASELRKISKGIQDDKAYQQQLKNNPPPVRRSFVVSWGTIGFALFLALKIITPAKIASWFYPSNSDVIGVPYTFQKPKPAGDLRPLDRSQVKPEKVVLEPGQTYALSPTKASNQISTLKFKLKGSISIGTEKVTVTPAGGEAQIFDFKNGGEVDASQVFPAGPIDIFFQSPFKENRLEVYFAE